jgi:hypothetical protein
VVHAGRSAELAQDAALLGGLLGVGVADPTPVEAIAA